MPRLNKEQDWERKQRAYDMRLRGKSYRAIGEELGIGHGTAHRWVQEILDAIVLPTVEAVRKQEIDRLMRYLDKLDERIEEGDEKSITVALKVSERLARMLGIDMPTQVEVTKNETTQLDLAIQDLISRQQAQNKLRLDAASHLREQAADPSDSVADDSSVERIVFDN